MGKEPNTVYGQHAEAPRVTKAALRIAFLKVAAPLIAGLLLFDFIVWWLVRETTGACFALWCWL